VTSMSRLEKFLLFVNGLILLALLVTSIQKSSSISDFRDYHRASLLLKEQKDIYQYEEIKELQGKYTLDDLWKDPSLLSKLESMRGNVASYIYPPTFATLLFPLSFLSYETASLFFSLLNYVCLLGSLYLMRELLYPSRFTYVLFFSLLFGYRFLENHVNNNQVAFFLLFLILLAIHSKQNVVIGFSLSLAVIIKLTPLIFVLFLFYKRKGKALFFFGLGLIFWAALPLLHGYEFGIQNWMNWLDMVLLSAMKNPVFRAWKNNQSLIATLAKYFLEGADPVNQLLFRMPFYPLSMTTVKLVFNFLALIILLPLFRKYKNGIDTNQNISALFLLSVIFSGISWIHTFAFLVFPLGYLYKRVSTKGNWKSRTVYYILGALIPLSGKAISGSFLDSFFLMYSLLLYISLGLYFLVLSLPAQEA
jgi:uncharacterized membrane protein (DUF441 family)